LEVRSVAVTPFIEAGRVFLIKAGWNESFLEELLMFPNAKHDEAVDMLTMAIQNGLDNKTGGFQDPIVGFVDLY
jgi:predicted phage terminase large subunit-like protein